MQHVDALGYPQAANLDLAEVLLLGLPPARCKPGLPARPVSALCACRYMGTWNPY